MIGLLSIALAIPTFPESRIDYDELPLALVVVWNPLVEPSPISNAALGDALAEALRTQTPLEPRVVDATGNDCTELPCFLSYARLDEPTVRPRVASIWDVSNRRSRDGAVVSIALRSAENLFAAMAAGVPLRDAELTATSSVVFLEGVKRTEELRLDAVVRRLVEAGFVSGGRQARTRLTIPAVGTLTIEPHGPRTVTPGIAVLGGLTAGPRQLSLSLEGYVPLDLELDLSLERAPELGLVRARTAAWWAKETTFFGGLGLIAAGGVVWAVDAIELAGEDNVCLPPNPCSRTLRTTPVIAALASAGAIAVAGELMGIEEETPWWTWAAMVVGGAGAGVIAAVIQSP